MPHAMPKTRSRPCADTSRDDAGAFRQLSAALIQALTTQYRAHPGWTVQLHYDNLLAASEQEAALQPLSSYSTIRRYMKAHGYHRKRTPKRDTPGGRQAEARLERLEVRSYEAEYVHGLWHADFHHGSRQVLTAEGGWVTPLLLCFIDDHSRLVCHLQWYLNETAEVLVHGLCQALQKRGLPRALMTDNGAAMKAEEFTVRAARAEHTARDHVALQPVSECQARDLLGHGGRASDGDARRRGRTHPGTAQRHHPGLGGTGIPSESA